MGFGVLCLGPRWDVGFDLWLPESGRDAFVSRSSQITWYQSEISSRVRFVYMLSRIAGE